jgi:hypothetical protein
MGALTRTLGYRWAEDGGRGAIANAASRQPATLPPTACPYRQQDQRGRRCQCCSSTMLGIAAQGGVASALNTTATIILVGASLDHHLWRPARLPHTVSGTGQGD